MGTEPILPRARYCAPVADFVTADERLILGLLAGNADNHAVKLDEIGAWRDQIAVLRRELAGLDGTLFLEFTIPRIGRRLDACLVTTRGIVVLEFKGAGQSLHAAREQAWDYALDLKNFHAGSRAAALIPIAVHEKAGPGGAAIFDTDGVAQPLEATPGRLGPLIGEVLQAAPPCDVDVAEWAASPYRPTPTIVEAARALYGRHEVHAILRNDAGARNLFETTEYIERLLERARAANSKIICFVTGVPGAGKTLAGLNIATRHSRQDDPTHAVYLSGNGPLVAVLREALARDEIERERHEGRRVRKGDVRRKIEDFIQNVHQFRKDGLQNPHLPPDEHVVIFDEAQRAWTRKRLANWLARRGVRNFAKSEPEVLIERVAALPDWALIVCLVGGGQEINTGEAGIGVWFDALERRFPEWEMHLSNRLTDDEYEAGQAVERARRHKGTRFSEALHLATSLRSFRAENVSRFVKALLDRETEVARREFATLRERYPIVVTRDLGRARQWLRERARGSDRFGLLASSRALRLKPLSIDVRIDIDPVRWFLDGPQYTDSSWYLEDAASEYDVQGLELDWACIAWDADMRLDGDDWAFRDFRRSTWTEMNPERRAFVKNAYRVLLTRARQGMVILVPSGEAGNRTRAPEYYAGVYDYLTGIGLPAL